MLIAGVAAIREAILFPAHAPRGRRPVPAQAVAPAEPPPVVAAAPPAAAPTAPVLPPRAPRVLGLLTALVGLVLLLADVIGAGRLIDAIDGGVAGHVATAVAGFGLLLVAGQLRRGKRRAWAGRGRRSPRWPPPPRGSAVPTRSSCSRPRRRSSRSSGTAQAFTGRPDPGSMLDVARFLPRFLVLALTFGLVARHVDGGRSYTATLLALGLGGILGVCLLAFRAVRADGAPKDRERARALVHAYGDDTLDYFALRPDKTLFFSASGDAMLAYRLPRRARARGGRPDRRARGARARLLERVPRPLPRARLARRVPGARERDLPLLPPPRPARRSTSATRRSSTATRSRSPAAP